MVKRSNFIRKPELPKLSSQSKDYHVVSSFLAQRADKLNIARLACQLKNIGDHDLANKAFNALFRVAPSNRQVVWGNSFPKQMSELGNGDNCFFFKPESLDREISWTIFGLKPYKERLSRFVSMRDNVEKCILLGNYSEANETLAQCVRQFGYSVWYNEMRLTIAGIQRNLEDGISLLTDINEAYQAEDAIGIVPILLQNIHNRSFAETPLRYDNLVRSTFKRNRDNSTRLDYYLFRLNYYQYYDLENLSEVVEMEHIQSAIDRYIMLLYVLRSCYNNQVNHRKAVLLYAKQLFLLTADSQLLPFLALSDEPHLPDSYYDESFIQILDGYYTGQYETTADLCRHYLNNNPSNLYVVKLYCRSLLFLGNGYQNVTSNTDSLISRITHGVYMVMGEKENKEYVENLNSLLKNIYGLHIAAQLDQFVKTEQRDPRTNQLAYLSINYFDPLFIRIIEEETRQKQYLMSGLQRIPGSVTIQYRLDYIDQTISDNSPIVAYIRNVDSARITFDCGDYERALEQWLKVFEETRNSIPTAQTVVDFVFRSYVALGTDYRQEAVIFYVNRYIENPSYVSKVVTDSFMNDIKLSRYSGMSNGLDLMLFVFLNADKHPQKQFVLQSYCKFEHVTYPSELIPKFRESKEPRKVELFFSILLNDDILFHHYKLKSTIDVLDEKLKIVNYLKEKNPDVRIYSDIYTELMHEIVAYRGMNKLDDSKIYVNEDAVMRYELSDIGPLFDRFRKQAALARKGSTVLLVGEINLNDPSGLTEFLKDTVSYSSDAVTDVAIDLFGLIRNAFLKSRFGLSTYLSTRIRHGVFEGEMRSFLERLDLILSTNNGVYVTETHWKHQYHIDPKAWEYLKHAMQRFSSETDNLILSFKDNVIQIRVDNNDSHGGLFCYDQPSEVISSQLMKLESESFDAQDFCKRVIGWLWEITEQCLERIRDKVQNELRPHFLQNLKELESCVEQISTHDTLRTDFLTAINKAREELNTHLVKVEKWFYRQEAKLEDFSLSDHLKMAFDTTSKYLTDVNVRMNVSIPAGEPLFRAQYSASMFDLLLIFLTNIFKYSYEEIERPVSFIVDFEDADIMHIHLDNKLRAGINEEKQNEEFQRRINEEAMIQKDHGSGLAKAMNIVKYDFGNPDNTYTIVAQERMCKTDIFIHLTNMVL